MNITLEGLEPGEWRHLTQAEVEEMLRLSDAGRQRPISCEKPTGFSHELAKYLDFCAFLQKMADGFPAKQENTLIPQSRV